MSDSFKTLSDLTTLNDKNIVDAGCSDLFDDAPLMAALAAGLASDGTVHKYIKQTGSAGAAFRDINTGLFNTASTDSVVTVTLKILDGSFAVDKAGADAYIKGGAAAYIARELRRKYRAVMFDAETQLIYGTTNDSSGFAGLASNFPLTGSTGFVDAGGSTANSMSSVYLIRTNDVGTDCQLVVGNDGQIVVGDTTVQRIVDTNGKAYPGYYTPVLSWMGLQIGSANSVVRIGNIGTSANKVTDALVYTGLEKFPASRQPNLIVMNRLALSQLRASRTATNINGAPAPRPTEIEGIQIVVTDAITNTEAVVAAE